MSDYFVVTANGLDSADNSNTRSGLRKYGSAKIAGFPPSMKLSDKMLNFYKVLTKSFG